MRFPTAFFSFPLLAKELTELAARRRTYTVRVAYAVALYTFFLALIPRWFWQAGYNPLEIMGSGLDMLHTLLLLQFAGVALFLPALMCGQIAREKERDSLGLLLLTELRPWSILLQKYASGLVPMLTFFLLGMPLAAVAYAFGGVTPLALGVALWCLFLGCLQVGAVALFCSAWCRTTVRAFVATYVLCAIIYFASPLYTSLHYAIAAPRSHWTNDLSFALLPAKPALMLERRIRNPWTGGRTFNAAVNPQTLLLLDSAPILASIAAFLLLARLVFLKRAFLPPSFFFIRLFRRIDRAMHRANRITGGTVLWRAASDLPADQPVAWRELTRRGLGRPQYLVRILVALEIAVMVLCLAVVQSDFRSGQRIGLSMLLAAVSALGLLGLCVYSANAIVSERVQQTLDVLLTTPLSARSIVRQKARALHRLCFVLAVPLLSVAGLEFWIETFFDPPARADPPAVYPLCALLGIAVYPPLFAWLSLWIGLRTRTRFKAIVTAVAVAAAWIAGPSVLLETMGSRVPVGWFKLLSLLSPAGIVWWNELSVVREIAGGQLAPLVVTVALNFGFYAAALAAIRALALADAERALRQ